MKNKYYKIAFYGIAIFLFFCLLSNKLNNNNKMLKVQMLKSKLAKNKKNNSQVSYGMFATEFIKNGELIENCPVLIEKVPGEEVTVNYGENYWKSRGITPNI
jgi:hypothetical protein